MWAWAVPWSRTTIAAGLGLASDEQGSALVELALVVALLGVPLLLATGEVGPLLYDAAEVQNAAHAGALYGMQSSTFAADTIGMITAAQTEATDFSSSLTVVPLTYYACATAIGGTQYTGSNAQSSAQSACTGTGNHPLEFVQVSTTLQVSPAIRCPGLATTFTLTGSSVMEVEQ